MSLRGHPPRRLLRLLPLLAALPACASLELGRPGPPEIPPELSLVVEERTYPVRGYTLDAIGRSLAAEGPVWEGDPAWGLTRWGVRWGWRSTMHEGTCRLVDLRVVVRVVITLPEWQDAGSASPPLIQDWQRFAVALRRHEMEHRDLGLQAGVEILETLRAQRATDCVAMTHAAGEAARAVLREYQRRNDAFERNTQRGRVQGATWPPP